MKKIITNVSLFLVGVLLGFGTFFFFVENKKEKDVRHKEIEYVSVDVVKKNVLLNGSINDYCNLKKIFDKTVNPEEILYYSLIMANKFNYVPANYDVYKVLTDFFARNNLGELDDETKRLAVSYLEYGANMGDSAAIETYHGNIRKNHGGKVYDTINPISIKEDVKKKHR